MFKSVYVVELLNQANYRMHYIIYLFCGEKT